LHEFLKPEQFTKKIMQRSSPDDDLSCTVCQRDFFNGEPYLEYEDDLYSLDPFWGDLVIHPNCYQDAEFQFYSNQADETEELFGYTAFRRRDEEHNRAEMFDNYEYMDEGYLF
jgi:hypothetical protein